MTREKAPANRETSSATGTAPTPWGAPPLPSRSPWQRFYGYGHQIRHRWWSQRAVRLPRPVLSIGNLHWGGTGKTPLVAAIAAHLIDAGEQVAILTRGYRSSGRGIRIVDPAKRGGQAPDPRTIGDEPALLAELLPTAAIIVSPDRVAGARLALEQLDPAPSVFLLDDGFSHLRLKRDLDLLVFPNADPFAGGRLWPSGRLREPLAAAQRADAALLTGSEGHATPARAEALAEALRPFGFAAPAFAAPLTARTPFYLKGQQRDGSDGRALEAGTPVLLVTGIARPKRVAQTASRFDLEIREHLEFADHHDYPPASIAKIRTAFRNSGATAVLVTSKDRVKLVGLCDLPLAELAVQSQPDAEFWSWFDRRWQAIRDAAATQETQETPEEGR